MCVCMCVCTCVCVVVWCVSMHVCVCVCSGDVHVCTCVCMYAHLFVCVHVYMCDECIHLEVFVSALGSCEIGHLHL